MNSPDKEKISVKSPLRFISQSKTAFKISLPTPEGSRRYRSIGFKKIGMTNAVKMAIKERDRIGQEEWGKLWSRILNDQTLLSRLPRNLEPTLRIASDKDSLPYEYVASWIERKGDTVTKVARRYSCDKHGKLAAYTKAKQALLTAHKEDLPLLIFMGRAPAVKLL